MFRVRCFVKVVAIVLALVLLASSGSLAQDKKKEDSNRPRRSGQGQFRGAGGRGAGGGFGKTSLLRAEAVQKELKITDAQKEQLRGIGEEVQKAQRELYSGLRDLPREERTKKFAELREQGRKLTQDSEKKLTGILNREQANRLNEINLQVRGLRAVADDDVAKELGLSDEQKKQLKGVFDAQQEKQRGLFGGFGGLRDLPEDERKKKFTEMREKGEALRKETQEKALAVLTDEQQGLYDLMKGAKFEFELRQLFQRRGGRTGQGGRGKKKAE